MASLGGMVAGVAHEINNPANFTYQGAVNLSRRLEKFKSFIFELAEAEEGSELADMFNNEFQPMFQNLGAIVDGTQRIKHIVEDLRSFSRLDEAEFKRADVIAGLETALTIFTANSQKDMDVVREYTQRANLDCWPAQLNQVFMNIMLNSHQAIVDKRVRSGGSFTRGTLRIISDVDDQWLKLQFQDNGCAMTEDVVRRLFEPFFATRPVGEGTGLGMSMSYGIVQKHNGQIEVTSEVGKGTTVTVSLPLPGK